jgi:hypothetical protein
MPLPYNPQGALNGLFAPAYIPGNPQSVAATTAWNAGRAPMTTPGTTPGAPPPAGPPPATFNPVVGNPGLQAALRRLPPNVQARFGSRFGMQPAPAPAGGSFTFTEPTAPANAMRNNIAQTLMNQPSAAQPSPNPLVNAGQSFFNQVAAPFQNFAGAATRLAMPNLASQLPSAGQGATAAPQTLTQRRGYGV